jgi:serine/threonine protein kinase
MALSPGDKFGPYELIAAIGIGGMGEVWKARDTRLDRIVAMKFSQEKFSERFEREAKAISSLNHPNICQLYDVGPNYLVMEYVEGAQLKGPLPLDQALKFGAQICAALDHAHKKGITHRDLKPANILVTKAGIKLLDFGLAKLASANSGLAPKPDDATLTMALTGKNEIVGTLYYMSPEQLQSQATGQEIDGRSDIFSFGLVLYEMLTGKRAFEGSSPASVIAAIMERPAPSVTDVAPPALDRVLKICLAKDPDERWQTARDLKRELEWIAAPSGEPVAPPAPSLSKTAPWHSYAGWAAAVLLLIATGTLGFLHFRETPPSPPTVMRFEIPLPGKVVPNRGGFLSPDGTKFVFPAVGPSGREIWIRGVDSLESHPIPGTQGTVGTRPFWSPDSRFIAFEAGGKLKKVDIAGGPVQTLCDLPANLLGGAWTQDGTLILGSNAGPIARVSSGGGVPVPVTKLASGENAHQFPFLLPDQHSFVYYKGGADASVYVGSLDRKPEEQSTKAIATSDAAAMYAPSPSDPMHGYLLTVKGGTLLAQPFDASKLQWEGDPVALAEQVGQFNTDSFVSVSNAGSLLYRRGAARAGKLAWYDRQGKLLSSPDGTFSIGKLVLSPDASRVAIAHGPPNGISIFDFARAIATRITFGNELSPVWSPDGSRIAYASGPSIYQKAPSGAGSPELLLQSPSGGLNPTDWSRDGRYLLYSDSSAIHLFVLPLEGDRKPFAFAQGSAFAGRFSPDTRWVAYISIESSGAEVYVRPFSGAPAATKNPSSQEGKWQISNGGAAQVAPAWRRDGREIYYESVDRYLMAVEVSSGPTFQPGTPRRLFPIPPTVTTTFDVTPDGQRFLLPVPADNGQESPFTMVLNWQAGLKK